ncbi:pectinesterase-like [Oryza brachyantha]|uniref:pectinesterase-like n=1 Tax=Oryza brachyantha TaxID=4533 RepID=UPI001ADC58DD|nr:pectinesterase-like [Oryza brachyantha]
MEQRREASALRVLCFLLLVLPRAISTADLASDGERLYQVSSVRAAMDQAAAARALAVARAARRSDGVAGSGTGQAWSDCEQLVAFAVGHLNRTAAAAAAAARGGDVASDVLAWLSAARTTVGTCLDGFAELAASPGPEFAAALTNVSRLVTDALAAAALRRGAENYTRATANVDWLRSGDDDGQMFQLDTVSPGDADVVVAKDGTGHFCTVGEALNAAAKRSNGGRRTVVYVKAGVYGENVEVWTSNLVLVGDGIGRTVITGSRSVRQGYTTFSSATFAVNADGFVACGVTFRNTAGAGAEQAVALRASGDRLAFYRCSFEGHQDTLYAHTLRHFYRECVVAGTTDFIFGNAAAVLQRCGIRVRRPPFPGQPAVVTAQGRVDRYERTGFAIHGGRVTAAAKFGLPGGAPAPFKTYLGRPWKEFSRVVYMEAYMDGTVDAAGWLPWQGTAFAQTTAFYGEYRNSGPGSSTSGRVRWGGYHVITDPSEASEFTAGDLVNAGSWLGSTGVPFTPGL